MKFVLFLVPTTLVAGFLAVRVVGKGVVVTKRATSYRAPTLAEKTESTAFDRAERAARAAFLRGDLATVRRFYEPLQKRLDEEPRRFRSAFGTVADFTVPLAACRVAGGDPKAALSLYKRALQKYPAGVTDLAGKMFYAATLTGHRGEIERTLDFISARTFSDSGSPERRGLDAAAPKDPRVLTLMLVARRLADDRNRRGADLALDLADRESRGHPAILNLRLTLLQTCFRDLEAFRTFGLRIDGDEIERVPALDSSRRRAEWLAEYERRWPRYWRTMTARERARFDEEKEDARRSTFAYEASVPLHSPYARGAVTTPDL